MHTNYLNDLKRFVAKKKKTTKIKTKMGQVKTTKCSFHAAKMKLKKTNQLHHKHEKKKEKGIYRVRWLSEAMWLPLSLFSQLQLTQFYSKRSDT